MTAQLRLDATAFEPGGRVTGWTAWEGRGTLVVSLLWFTSGRGTEDVQVIAQERHEVDDPGERQFAFDLPAAPWSFTGTLVTLTWAVEVTLEPGGAAARAPLVCAPGGAPVRL